MSKHQESLKQVVARIEASFVKIKSYGEKVDQFRISAGKQLVELKVRIEAGEAGKGVKWWFWYAENFKNRSRRDAQRVMALANADDPEKAAEEERTKARDGMAAHRERVAATNVSRDSQPASPPKDYRLTEDEHAAQIVRDVEWEIANLDGEGLDLDLVRELVLQKLTFSFKGEVAEKVKDAEPPAKRLSRPPGSKNKAKEAGSPEPARAPIGNAVDVDDSAAAMRAKMAELEDSAAIKTPDDTLDVRGTFLDRRNEAGAQP
jgi:hypothetical protein